MPLDYKGGKLMKAKLLMTVEQMQNRDEWLKVRSSGIGGSDAATILGLNPYRSPFSLWLEKTNQIDVDDNIDNETMYWGRVMEQLIADRFTDVTGKKVKKHGIMQSEQYPFMLASVDRLVVGENAGLEIKTTSLRNKYQWEDDDIPNNYYCQCLHYLAVTGLDRWYIACLIGGQEMVWKVIERKNVEADIQELIRVEKEWWEEHIINRRMPEVDGSDNCSKALASRFKTTTDRELELGEDVESLCNKIDNLNAQIKALNKENEEAKNKVKVLLGDTEVATTEGHIIKFKYQNGKPGFDREKFDKDYPGIYNQYTIPTRNRVFRTSIVKDDDKKGEK